MDETSTSVLFVVSGHSGPLKELTEQLASVGIVSSVHGLDSVRRGAYSITAEAVHVVVLWTDMECEGGLPSFAAVREAFSTVPIIVASSRLLGGGGAPFVALGAYGVCDGEASVGEIIKSILGAAHVCRQGRLEREWTRFIASEVVTLRLRSRELGFLKVPLALADRLFDAGLLGASERLRLVTAFQEAVMNAHEHGNLELESSWRQEIDAMGVDTYTKEKIRRLKDPTYADRLIVVTISFDGFEIRISVRDEGKGYPAHIREGVSDSLTSFDQPFGRGLTLIRWGTDEVTFDVAGNTVTLVKRVQRTDERRLWQ